MKLKTFNLTILVVTFLTLITLPTISGFQGSFESLPRYFDASMPYSYLIESNGTHTFMMNGTTHQMELSSTNTTQIINYANANASSGATSKQTVFLREGVYTISVNSSVLLYDWVRMIGYGAIIRGSNGTYSPLLKNANQTNGNTGMEIRGITFDGYQRGGLNNHLGAKGIEINNNNVNKNPSRVIELYDVKVGDVYDNAIEIQLYAGDSMYLSHTWSCDLAEYGGSTTTRIGMKLKAGDSFIVDGCISQAFYEQLYLEGGTFTISDFYAGAGVADASESDSAIFLKAVARCVLTNVHVDYCSRHGVKLEGSNFCHFVNVRMRGQDTLSGNNTFSAFVVTDSDWNVFESCYGGRYSLVSVSDLYKYGWEETGTSDMNMVVGCNFKDVGTSGIITVGADTKVANSWNGTTWIS